MTESPLGNVLRITELAGEIVAAYVSHNPVPPAELPTLITKVHSIVSYLSIAHTSAAPAVAGAVNIDKPTIAQIRKSVRHNGIASFIDGKTYKTLKRHLSAHGLDVHSYRELYGLPADYPMVARATPSSAPPSPRRSGWASRVR